MDTLAARVAKRAAQTQATDVLDEHLAVAPPGWENTVKKMKKHPGEIDNPWALAWHMKNKGDKPGGKEAGMPEQFEQAEQEGMTPEPELPESRFPEKQHEMNALAVKLALQARTAPELEKKFHELLNRDLKPFLKDLPNTEQYRAEDAQMHAYRDFNHAITFDDKDEIEHALKPVREKLTELERLLQGQRMLFAAVVIRTAGESAQVTHVFKQLFEICDELPHVVEADTLRRLGIKPAPSRPGPGKPATPRKKPSRTYKQAQDDILTKLKEAGWLVVPHLKIPHATSPRGQFRYWFKPQAIYYSQGPSTNDFGKARSMWTADYRDKPTEEMVHYLEQHAHG